MTICISCGLDSENLNPNYPGWLVKKADDGTYHWIECHNVGGDLNANKSPCDSFTKDDQI